MIIEGSDNISIWWVKDITSYVRYGVDGTKIYSVHTLLILWYNSSYWYNSLIEYNADLWSSYTIKLVRVFSSTINIIDFTNPVISYILDIIDKIVASSTIGYSKLLIVNTALLVNSMWNKNVVSVWANTIELLDNILVNRTIETIDDVELFDSLIKEEQNIYKAILWNIAIPVWWWESAYSWSDNILKH